MRQGRFGRYLSAGLRTARPLDLVVLIVAAGVITAFSLVSLERGGPGALVEIHSDAGRFVYSLDQDAELTFAGPIGDSVVHIHDNSVYFVASPCRDKICIAAGALTEAGQWAACLPNRVFVTVLGENNDPNAVDATAF